MGGGMGDGNMGGNMQGAGANGSVHVRHIPQTTSCNINSRNIHSRALAVPRRSPRCVRT